MYNYEEDCKDLLGRKLKSVSLSQGKGRIEFIFETGPNYAFEVDCYEIK